MLIILHGIPVKLLETSNIFTNYSHCTENNVASRRTEVEQFLQRSDLVGRERQHNDVTSKLLNKLTR